jgi:RHS repeat-associated protein
MMQSVVLALAGTMLLAASSTAHAQSGCDNPATPGCGPLPWLCPNCPPLPPPETIPGLGKAGSTSGSGNPVPPSSGTDPGTLGNFLTPAQFGKLIIPNLPPIEAIRKALGGVSASGGLVNSSVGFLQDDHDSLLGLVPATMRLPVPQGNTRSLPAPPVPGTEPVAANGEFILEETDVTLAGIGLPFQFTRYYRSGIDYQSSLGWGWNHNFGLRLVEAVGTYDTPQGCNTMHNDVFVVTEWMDRMRFAYAFTEGSVDHYVSRVGKQGYRLRKDQSDSQAPWILEDGKGREYRFHQGWGTLASINDFAGHSLLLRWDRAKSSWDPPGGRLTEVIDTTGRVIYFNYQTANFEVRTNETRKYEFEALRCLSLTPDCASPLVSFQMRGAIGTNLSGQIRVEFDLERVLDGNGNGPTYKYYDGDSPILNMRDTINITSDGRNWFSLVPSADVPGVCASICSDKVSNCRNEDICPTFVAEVTAKCDSLVGNDSGNFQLSCYFWCMSKKDYTDRNGFESAAKSCQAVSALSLSNDTIPQLTRPECEPFRNECYQKLGDIPTAIDKCRSTCMTECLASRGSKRGYIYGVKPALTHNLMKVIDGDGRVLVDNTYGEDPHSPDFDKVITHRQGDEANNTITFTYYDLQAPMPSARPDDQFVVHVTQFNSLDICPSGGPSPASFLLGPHPVQPPKYATVIHDIDGVIRTNYHDPGWRLIRSINHTANLTSDLNYHDGALSAVRSPAGNRVCVETDSLGKPTLLTEYPAPGFPGEQTPLVTQFTYDDREQLIEVVRNPDSPRPSGRHFNRDVFERVIAIGDQVDKFHTAWTCYSYADPIMVNPRIGTVQRTGTIRFENLNDSMRRHDPERIRVREELQRPFHNAIELEVSARGKGTLFSPPAFMFFPSGCAAAIHPVSIPPGFSFSPRMRHDLPSIITRPDGSVTKLEDISSGGPGKVIIDANGEDPLGSYSTFDELGRLSETGRLLAQNGTPTRYPAQRVIYDAAGLLTTQSTADPNTSVWVDTIYGYDKSHHITSVTSPAYTRQLTISPLGDVRTISDVPIKDDSAKSRTSCMQYDVHGRLLFKVLPEGNIEGYLYDAAGRLKVAYKGYTSSPLGSWAAKCNPTRATLGVPTPTETIAAFEYDAVGFPSSALVDGTRVRFTVDGFGRVIDTQVPDRESANGTVFRHLVKGYDTDGRIAWEGVFDQPPQDYARPTALQGGLHAFSEYEYDLLGRRTVIKQWRFTDEPLAADPEGLIAKTTYTYDDSTNTVNTTDPAGRVSILRTDGAGRLLSDVRAVGLAEELSLSFSYSLDGTVMDVTRKPAPVPAGQMVETFRFDPIGRLRSVAEGNRTVYTEQQDFLGRTKERAFAGLGKQSIDYDAYGRLAGVHQWMDSVSSPVTSTYEWNGNDLLRQVLDGAGHSTVNTFDGLDRLATVTNGIGKTRFIYALGTQRIVQRTEPSGATHYLTYDPAGRVSRIISSPEGLSIASLITGSAEGLSIKREFAYTALDQLRLASLLGSQSNTVTFEYDSLGRKRFEANDALRLGVSHTYSSAAKTTELVRAGITVATITETYDALFRPRIVSLNGTPVATMSYDSGLLSSILYGNGAQETFGYDGRGRLTSAKVNSAGAVVAAITDVLGVDGIPRQRQRAFGSLAPTMDLYQTDFAGRLQSENNQLPSTQLLTGEISNADVGSLVAPGHPWTTYSLDGAANWTAKNGPGALHPVIDGANRFSQIDGTTVGYDGNGRMSTFNGTLYTFNALGALTSISEPGIQRNYAYDALGRRIRESDSQSAGLILWDGSRILGVQPEGQGEATRIHVASEGYSALALVNALGMGQVSFLHPATDRSTFAATDGQGKLIEGYMYSAYGETSFIDPVNGPTAQSRIGNRFLFQGHFYEPGLGLYMLPAREYQPRWGRFLSPDPIGIAGGLNLYAYVGARPLSDIDINGLSGSRTILPPMLEVESASRFELQKAVDRIQKRLWEPQLSKVPLNPTTLDTSAQTPWVLENASDIVGVIQGTGTIGDPTFYVRRMSNDAYHIHDKDGRYKGSFGVRSTATPSAFQPGDLAGLYIAPGVRAGKAALSSLLKGGTSEGLETTLGSDVALKAIGGRVALSPALAQSPEGLQVASRLASMVDKIHSSILALNPIRFNMSTTAVLETSEGLIVTHSSRYISTALELKLAQAAEEFGATFISGTRISSVITNHAETAAFEIFKSNGFLGALRGLSASRPFCKMCSPEVIIQGLIIIP